MIRQPEHGERSAFTRRPRRYIRRALVVSLLVGLVWCAAVEAWLPREDPVDKKLNAVMVLSSGVRKDGTLDQNSERRFQGGILLAKSTRAPLYISRVQRKKEPRLMSDSGQARLADSANLGRWTILNGVASNTHDEAERFLRTVPLGSIAVVTSRLHTRRACATFEKLGYEVTCVSAGPEQPLWKTPYFVAYESAALVKYWLEGWV